MCVERERGKDRAAESWRHSRSGAGILRECQAMWSRRATRPPEKFLLASFYAPIEINNCDANDGISPLGDSTSSATPSIQAPESIRDIGSEYASNRCRYCIENDHDIFRRVSPRRHPRFACFLALSLPAKHTSSISGKIKPCTRGVLAGPSSSPPF